MTFKLPPLTLQQAIQEIQSGNMLIIIDREDRENEGDLFFPAATVTPEKVNFMITEARGLVCVPITESRAQELSLPLMVPDQKNTEFTKCRFTIPVDAKACTGSGISAFDRTLTIKALADNTQNESSFVTPGHIFPLIGHPKGLIARDGHTEAAIHLAKLSGYPEAGVICELLAKDGTMLRGQSLLNFATLHNLKILSITSLLN